MNKPNIRPFGTTETGEEVSLISLSNGILSCEILTYGAVIRTLKAPDRQGNPVDLVLGFDDLKPYLFRGAYFGATVGRFANRIAKGIFTLNGKTYHLATNNGANHLHGGNTGFSNRIWQVEELEADRVTLSLTSPDGEEGYPGNLTCTATFRLEGDKLVLGHWATTDADTLCSLTNHSYFNLSGHDSGSVLDQQVQIFARYYTPTDEGNIPLGHLEEVAGTPMDLREPAPLDNPQRRAYPALVACGGFDHNFVIDGHMGTLRPAAKAYSPRTGITMEVETTLPGIQFYSGNYIHPKLRGKGDAPYAPWQGFCLETQFFPDSPNQPAFPSPVLKAGETFNHTTVFKFSTK